MSSILGYLTSDQDATVGLFKKLQKRLQYGLPNKAAISFYELGFSDRVIALEMGTIAGHIENKTDAVEMIKSRYTEYEKILYKYPEYFMQTLKDCQNRSI